MPAGHLVSRLGACPSNYPVGTPLQSLNAGVRSLKRQLVPIAALNVRICEYSHREALIGHARLLPVAAAKLHDETNEVSDADVPFGCPAEAYWMLVTFANDAQQENLSLTSGCGDVTSNGALSVSPTERWLSDLRHDIRSNA